MVCIMQFPSLNYCSYQFLMKFTVHNCKIFHKNLDFEQTNRTFPSPYQSPSFIPLLDFRVIFLDSFSFFLRSPLFNLISRVSLCTKFALFQVEDATPDSNNVSNGGITHLSNVTGATDLSSDQDCCIIYQELPCHPVTQTITAQINHVPSSGNIVTPALACGGYTKSINCIIVAIVLSEEDLCLPILKLDK